MQPHLQVFLAFLLAHLLGDFPFQTKRMVEGKQSYRVSAYASHGLTHLLVAAVGLALFTEASLTEGAALAGLALLTVGHLLLDLAKSALIRARAELDRLPLFVADQLLHVVIVAAATLVVVGTAPAIGSVLDAWLERRDTILVTAVVLIGSIFPAGYLIRYLLLPLSKELGAQGTASSEELRELSNAGLYLGWLERALLVVAFASGSFTAVGLIVGAKSIARFPEFKSRAFAEYFLIGTLASVAVAAVGGWVLRAALAAAS